MAVVQRVANSEGVDPADLSPLFDVVDPDALDALVCRSDGKRSAVEISFTYCGYDVTVTSDGVIHLEDGTPPKTPA